jgi:hypothetical protein
MANVSNEPRDATGKWTSNGTTTPRKLIKDLKSGDRVWYTDDYGRTPRPVEVDHLENDGRFTWVVLKDGNKFGTVSERDAGIVRDDHPQWVKDSKIVTPYTCDLPGSSIVPNNTGRNEDAAAWRQGLGEEDQTLLRYWEQTMQAVHRIRSNPDDSAVKHLVDLFNSAPKAPDTIYRGIDTDQAAKFVNSVGRTFRVSVPTSSSTRLGVAAAFGGCVLRIRGADGHIIGNTMDEAVTLPGRYRVTDVHNEKVKHEFTTAGFGAKPTVDTQIVDVEYLGPADWKPPTTTTNFRFEPKKKS